MGKKRCYILATGVCLDKTGRCWTSKVSEQKYKERMGKQQTKRYRVIDDYQSWIGHPGTWKRGSTSVNPANSLCVLLSVSLPCSKGHSNSTTVWLLPIPHTVPAVWPPSFGKRGELTSGYVLFDKLPGNRNNIFLENKLKKRVVSFVFLLGNISEVCGLYFAHTFFASDDDDLFIISSQIECPPATDVIVCGITRKQVKNWKSIGTNFLESMTKIWKRTTNEGAWRSQQN